MIIIIILIVLAVSYIGFIVVPAVLLYRFAFGRKPCSVPLNEFGTLEGTRYAPFSETLIPADKFVHSQPFEKVSVTARDGVLLRGRYLGQNSPRTMIFVHGYAGAPISNFCAQAERFCRLGWNLLFITERAHGESGGKRLGFACFFQADSVYNTGNTAPDSDKRHHNRINLRILIALPVAQLNAKILHITEPGRILVIITL